jgi:nucleoside-triphosphatase THEP1
MALVCSPPPQHRTFHLTRKHNATKTVSLKVREETELPPPSEEQKAIVAVFQEKKSNLIINACAGAGKTTLILRLIQGNPQLNFLVLSYNNRLTHETRDRSQRLGLANAEVSTVHAQGFNGYSRECSTDAGLKRVVEDDMPLIERPRTVQQPFDVIVIDEAQDMTPIMKRFLDKLCRDMAQPPKSKKRLKKHQFRVVILGDPLQQIYDFNNADKRFLELADDPHVFGYLNSYPWYRMSMSASNRLTPLNARFVNKFAIIPESSGEKIFSANHEGMTNIPPRYVVWDPSNPVWIVEEILKFIENGIKPDDIIILSPSMRASAAARNLTNALAEKLVPIHIPNSEMEIDPKCAYGKIVCCTFHQAKGIQRKIAYVLHFDSSYYKWYDRRPLSQRFASNPLYVAVTRAVERLTVLHDYRQSPLPFVSMDDVQEEHDAKQLVLRQVKELLPPISPKEEMPRVEYRVTDLLRNLSDEFISACLTHLAVTEIQPASPFADPQSIVSDIHQLYESVSEITGTAAVSIFEMRSRAKCSLVRSARSPRRSFRSVILARHKSKSYRICKKFEETGKLDLPDHLYLASVHVTQLTGFINKLVSIPVKSYNWLDQADADSICRILEPHVPPPQSPSEDHVVFEAPFDQEFEEIANEVGGTPILGAKLKGAPDIIIMDQRKIIEVKYKLTFSQTDVLQAALYMSMAQRKHGGTWIPLLISGKTSQIVKVEPKTKHALKEIMQNLVDYKNGAPLRHGPQKKMLFLTDEEFLEECKSGFKERVLPMQLPEWYGTLPEDVDRECKRLTMLRRATRRKAPGKGRAKTQREEGED